MLTWHPERTGPAGGQLCHQHGRQAALWRLVRPLHPPGPKASLSTCKGLLLKSRCCHLRTAVRCCGSPLSALKTYSFATATARVCACAVAMDHSTHVLVAWGGPRFRGQDRAWPPCLPEKLSSRHPEASREILQLVCSPPSARIGGQQACLICASLSCRARATVEGAAGVGASYMAWLVMQPHTDLALQCRHPDHWREQAQVRAQAQNQAASAPAPSTSSEAAQKAAQKAA